MDNYEITNGLSPEEIGLLAGSILGSSPYNIDIGEGTSYFYSHPKFSQTTACFTIYAERVEALSTFLLNGINKEAMGTMPRLQNHSNGKEDFAWFKANYCKLKLQYEGQWLAIANKVVVANGSMKEAYQQAKAKGCKRPLIVRVGEEGWKSPWR